MSNFWEEVGKLAAPGIAQAAIRSAQEATQTRGDIMRLFAHDYAVTKEIQREATARGWGIQDAQNFRAPYGQLTVNAVSQAPPAPVQQQPAAAAGPAKQPASLMKTLAMTALMATGGGGLVAAGGFGAYTLLKDQLNQKVEIKPADFKVDWKLGENGMNFGPIKPDNAEPAK
jgi:hypothetical protein